MLPEDRVFETPGLHWDKPRVVGRNPFVIT